MKYNLPKFNCLLIAICLVIIVVGFVLTAGPASGDVYNPDIFSTRRITVGPMISLLGFVLMIVAILFPNRKNKQ